MIIDYRGQRIEFPDNMPVDQIQAALAQMDDAGGGPQPSRTDSLRAGASSGVTLGFNDELKAALGAGADAIFQGGDFANYGRLRDAYRQEEAQAQAANPGAYLGGALLGGGVIPLPGAAQVAGARTAGQLGMAMGRQGAQIGAATGLGTSEADLTQGDVLGALADTATGATVGGAAGGVLGGVLAPGAKRAVQGIADARARLNAPPVRPPVGAGGAGGGSGGAGGPVPPPAGLLAGLQSNISPASAEYQAAVAALERSGIPLTRGQQSGSNFLKMAETTLADTIGGGPLQRQSEAQRVALQRAMLGMAGHPDPAGTSGMITPSVLKETRAEISRQYGDAFANARIDVNEPAFVTAIDAAEARNAALLPFEQRAQIGDIAEQFRELGFNQGSLTGEEYQRLRSELGRRATASANQTHSSMYIDLKKALDDAFRIQTGIDTRPINARHAAVKTMEEVQNRLSGPAAAEGMLNPLVVARQAVKKGTTSDEFEDLMRSAATVLPDRTANSGTAQRQTVMGLRNLGGQLAVGGGAAALGGVPAMAGAAGIAYLMSGALANPNISRGLANAGLSAAELAARKTGQSVSYRMRATTGAEADELARRERQKRASYLGGR
ncbi:hypothetical protein UFOVP1008_30 [uncultured Caudovirales phage]|uniref:Uncharacterized protein n=1 Tax=uncultured Caudovirales phage TaxID=2100421 RepID=A0A6J5MND3_9CAUD|nr:hypothetical protein UFOVP498_38 [uncultured Caudovirales phage]CAB4177675.1 hypothetical protein UFOVP1008_30 [uncultured Caudovirales phage]CAB4187187.1 hypothetical protein UFOVP1160_16 [uncultured Caudovirales phage]CAB4200148.1 hypothetical protein UFOVP1352_34 [uncultured Caudovirales phage]